MLSAWSDVIESLRSRWFLVYTAIFGGIVVLLFLFGITESRIMGFTGLSRLLITYIQLALAWCFLGIGMLISTLARSADVAQGAAFVVWLTLILFLDLIMLGILIRENLTPQAAVAISLLNPLQVFRTAAMMLFDAQLVLLGPTAFIILDAFGNIGYLAWALVYPFFIGTLCASVGYILFRRSDLP